MLPFETIGERNSGNKRETAEGYWVLKGMDLGKGSGGGRGLESGGIVI